MRILILGAGGTGGYFGGRLSQAGVDVTFLVRPARAAALARDGLVIESPLGDARLQVQTVQSDGLKAGAWDGIILSCKAYDLDSSIDAIAPAVGTDTLIIPLLNGMSHLDKLDQRFGASRVAGGLCQISATLSPDGHVRHLNRAQAIIFGPRSADQTAKCTLLAECFAKASFDSKLSPDIAQEMWEKWVMLGTLAAMTCLMRSPIGSIVAAPGGGDLMQEALAESAEIASAAGYRPRTAFLDRARTMLTEPGSAMAASMLRDLLAGGRIEADHVIGDMLSRARPAGIAAPLLRVAYTNLKTYEAASA